MIADDSTPAEFTAADLIAQAEHAPGASVLITWSPGLVERIAGELERQLAVADRGGRGPAQPGTVRGLDYGGRSQTKPHGWPTSSPPSICTSPARMPTSC